MSEDIYSSEFVEGLFNRMSNSYERMNYITSFGFSLRWRRQFLKKLKPSSEELQVIDLMTGMGETWGAAKKYFPHSKLSALDICEGMLSRAGNKNQKYFKNEVNILKQDVLKNNLPDNYYDRVICAFGLKTFNQDQVKTLAKEVYRILKPGGEISFIEVSNPKNFFLSFLYAFHLGKVVPFVGWLFLGGPAEYKMLWKYTSAYKDSEMTYEIFQNSGLQLVYHSYFFGCATGFSGRKPSN